MGKNEYELTMDTNLNGAKEITDELMGKMGFTMTYTSTFEAIANRGGGLSSAIMGPLAGKNNIAVKFALSFRENSGKTTILLADSGSGLGKAVTLTGGTTKKVLADVFNSLREGVSRKGLLV